MSAAPSSSGLGGPLRDSDYQKLLKESGIRREWIDRAQFLRVDDAQGRAACGAHGGGDYSGILMPYFLPGETSPREYVLRRDTPDLEYNAKGNPKAIKKYMFPPGRGNILYYCPGTTSSQLADRTLPILFVEGVKKALAVNQVAWDAVSDTADNPLLLTVAISGVWNWRGTIGKQPSSEGKPQLLKGPIPDLDRIEYRRRKIIIAFDTNVETLEQVQSARQALTKELSKRGALVYWVHWPANTPDSVNGLDDLLARAGADRVQELIQTAKPYPESAPGIHVYSYTELVAAHFPVSSPIAEDFLHEGETIAVVGKPKQGKSRLVQQFAIDVSRGRSFLGHKVPKARRV